MKRGTIAIVLSLLMAFSCVLVGGVRLSVAQTGSSNSSWSITALGSNAGDLRPLCPIALDSSGNPCVAINDVSLGLTYAHWNGSFWNLQSVPSGGLLMDFALDSNNSPHMLFLNSQDVDGYPFNGGTIGGYLVGGLYYASLEGSKWTIQPIDVSTYPYWSNPNNNGISCAALAFDSENNPHVAYANGSGDVNYASWTGTSWVSQTVDTLNVTYGYPRLSLAIDSNNTVYLLYEGQPYPKLAVYRNNSWEIQNVTAATDIDSFGNMVLDSKSNPHFIYLTTNNTIAYVSWNGTAWNSQLAVSNLSSLGVAGILTNAFLQLDYLDNPHIAYITGGVFGFGALTYASWNNGIWENQTVSSSIAAGACSLAIDPEGKPSISLLGYVIGSPAEELSGAYTNFCPVMYATTSQPIVYPPLPTPMKVSAIATSGTSARSRTTVELPINGNITATQISNVTIVQNQSAQSTGVSFGVTGQNGTEGFSNMTLPKSAVTYGMTPAVYLDGQLAAAQGYAEDATNYYVWFTTQFGTQQVAIDFTTPTLTPSPTPTQTPAASPSIPEFSSWIALASIFLITAFSVVAFLVRKRH